VVTARIKTTTKGKLMNDLLPLSPLEDEMLWCDICEEETLHVSYLTALDTNPLAKFYALECEICMLSAEWV
jgi:hypothetical protein